MKRMIYITLFFCWISLPNVNFAADAIEVSPNTKIGNKIIELYQKKRQEEHQEITPQNNKKNEKTVEKIPSESLDASNLKTAETPEIEAEPSNSDDFSATENYVIGPGDVIDISIWRDEVLTKRVTVLPDGKIAFPLIGEITAAGKTLAQFRKKIEKEIDYYVPNPVLSVSIDQVNSMIVYVIGKVNNPGRFILNSNADVLQVLAMSGGLNSFAKRNKIKIFRRSGEQTKVFNFRYDEVAEGENLEQNIYLEKGDVIVVP